MAAIVYLKHTKSHTSCTYFHTKNKKNTSYKPRTNMTYLSAFVTR